MTEHEVLSYLEDTFNEIYVLRSIIKITRDVCQEKEFNSLYYNLSQENLKSLSEERNHYINMLTMALDKVAKLESINESIEKAVPVL